MAHTPSTMAAVLMGLTVAMAAGVAHSQTVYRIVGPDGRVSFSDQPPADAATRSPVAASNAAPSADGGAQLPFALRQVASRFPVTLYTSSDCVACGAGRDMLASRGIPFTERTVTGDEDLEALQRLSGSSSVPLLTIGSQQLRGFSQFEWKDYLDAAGYPANSQLPTAYRPPTARPLVAVQRPVPGTVRAPAEAARRSAEASTTAAAPPVTLSEPSPPNPTGIRF